MDKGSIELAIDWGTSKWTAAVALNRDGKRISDVSPLNIGDLGREVPMMATWVDGKLVQGYKLRAMADNDCMLSDKIIDQFKLALYQSDETSKIRKRVEDILAEFPGNKTLEMLIEEHIRAVIEEAKEAIAKSEVKARFRQKGELQEALEKMKVCITVPEMWTPQARQRIQRAARRAGLNVVVLASEASCAFAYLVHKESRDQATGCQYRKGDIILVVALGCGTGDFVLCKIMEDLSKEVKLKQIGHSSGDLCGSSQVDEILLQMLFERMGRDWLVKTTLQLGVSDRDFRRRALVAIEKAKREFASDDYNALGTIRGIKGQYQAFELTRKEIRKALDVVIGRIFKATDKHMAKKTPDYILVTGGFAKSGYLMEKFRERYMPQNIVVVRPNDTDRGECYPVAVGALRGYEAIRDQKLPQQYGYALLQDEEADPSKHPDAYENIHEFDGTNEDDLYYQPWVQPSAYEPEPKLNEGEKDPRSHWVLDRIRTIIKKGDQIAADQEISHPLKMMFYVPVGDPHITAKYAYLEKKFPESGASTRIDKEGKVVWKDGVRPWHFGRVNLPTKMLEKNKFEKITLKDGDQHWKVYARVLIRCRDHDMHTGFEILKPSSFKGLGKRKANPEYEAEVVFRGWDTVWEASHSDFLE